MQCQRNVHHQKPYKTKGRNGTIKSMNNRELSEKTEVMQRWKEDSEELYNYDINVRWKEDCQELYNYDINVR